MEVAQEWKIGEVAAATLAVIIVVYGLIFGTNWPPGVLWEAMRSWGRVKDRSREA
jgi:hypothetical protein